jgi:TolB protein
MTCPAFPRLFLGVFLGVAPLLVGCDDAVLGPTLRGTVDGRVLTFDGQQPVAGASITTSPATGAYVTDATGAFALSNIESGAYNITVRKSGFRANTLSVAVRDDATTPATILLERDAEATRTDSLAAEIVNWANRVEGPDSTFVDVEYRVRNAGTDDVAGYEVYVRIETDGDPFFQEIRGEALPAAQADIATVSKFIRGATATAVRVDDLWFDAGSGTD